MCGEPFESAQGDTSTIQYLPIIDAFGSGLFAEKRQKKPPEPTLPRSALTLSRRQHNEPARSHDFLTARLVKKSLLTHQCLGQEEQGFVCLGQLLIDFAQAVRTRQTRALVDDPAWAGLPSQRRPQTAAWIDSQGGTSWGSLRQTQTLRRTARILVTRSWRNAAEDNARLAHLTPD